MLGGISLLQRQLGWQPRLVIFIATANKPNPNSHYRRKHNNRGKTNRGLDIDTAETKSTEGVYNNAFLTRDLVVFLECSDQLISNLIAGRRVPPGRSGSNLYEGPKLFKSYAGNALKESRTGKPSLRHIALDRRSAANERCHQQEADGAECRHPGTLLRNERRHLGGLGIVSHKVENIQ